MLGLDCGVWAGGPLVVAVAVVAFAAARLAAWRLGRLVGLSGLSASSGFLEDAFRGDG